jgi:hypothetical protein
MISNVLLQFLFSYFSREEGMVVVKAYVTAGRQSVDWINWLGTATAF